MTQENKNIAHKSYKITNLKINVLFYSYTNFDSSSYKHEWIRLFKQYAKHLMSNALTHRSLKFYSICH